MPTRQAVIIGAGGHGREMLNWLRDSAPSDLAFLGFLDDGTPSTDLLSRLGAPHLGPVSLLAELPNTLHYLGVGSPQTRRELAARALALGSQAGPALVHPRAYVGADVTIGAGSVVSAGVVVTTHVRIGTHTHLSSNAVVGHDAVLGDFVSVYPGATISGNVVLGDGALIGTNATVIQGLSIGADSVVGAGAAVVTDIPSDCVAVGVPARAR